MPNWWQSFTEIEQTLKQRPVKSSSSGATRSRYKKLTTWLLWLSAITLLGIWSLLAMGCATSSPNLPVTAKPPQLPPPPAGMFISELKPSQYYSMKLIEWRKKADAQLTTLEMNSGSAVDTSKQ